MRRDPQEMGGGTYEQRVSRQPQCALRSEGGKKKKKKKHTFVPPGNTFSLERLPEAVKGIRIKSAADFTSDGIFDCVFCKFSIFRVSFSKEKKKKER